MSAAHLSSLINSISASFATFVERQNKLENELRLLKNGNGHHDNVSNSDGTLETLVKDLATIRYELKNIKEEPKSSVSKDDIISERMAFQKDISTFQMSANFKMEQYVNKLVKEKIAAFTTSDTSKTFEIHCVIEEKIQSIMNIVDEKLKAQEKRIVSQIIDAKVVPSSENPQASIENMFASLSDIDIDINTINEGTPEGEQKKRGRKPTKVVIAQG